MKLGLVKPLSVPKCGGCQEVQDGIFQSLLGTLLVRKRLRILGIAYQIGGQVFNDRLEHQWGQVAERDPALIVRIGDETV